MILPGPFTDDEIVNVIIETPKGSRSKYTFDEKMRLFKLSKTLPAGLIFPMDFGFLPGTTTSDEGRLDILIMMNDKTYPGCYVECRLIGVIEAEQTEGTKTIRNDRLMAVAINSQDMASIKRIRDIKSRYLDELIHFFKYYHAMEGKKFIHLRYGNARAAYKIVKKIGPSATAILLKTFITTGKSFTF